MKKFKIKHIFLIITVLAVSCFFFQACKETQVSLHEDLRFGVDKGDDNLVFGGIFSICFDSEDNIHILDSRMWRIQKFDSRGAFLKSFVIQEG